MSPAFVPRSTPATPLALCLALAFAAACGAEGRAAHRGLTAAERDSAIARAVRVALDPASLAAEASLMPRFEAYPVADPFTGTPAPVDRESAEGAREFAAVLRAAAAKGPNFARHYTVVTWVDDETPRTGCSPSWTRGPGGSRWGLTTSPSEWATGWTAGC